MEIRINDQIQFVEERHTLSQLMISLGHSALEGVAVAVNDRVVERERWSSYELKHQDSVLLITATQGG